MSRILVMGDPQAPFAKVLEVLLWYRALDGDRLASDVVLVSIGDHFDYDVRDPRTAAQEGLKLLRWLASHDSEQAVLLLGNHDAARVMELATIDDARFEAARTLAREVDEHKRSEDEYREAFPDLPPPGVIGRDYASFTSEQRALVMELLLAGRFHLARSGALSDGREVLITHAGITTRELDVLRCDGGPPGVANALDASLVAAVDRVRSAWRRGMLAPLSLEPLHITGGNGEEGGGLLYHRPANPARRGNGWHAERPRRFDPHELPINITQIVGHSGHAKCVEELGPWVAPAARKRKHGGIRTLRVAGELVIYDLGIAPPSQDVADLILVDGELRRVPATEVALLPLSRLD